MTLWVGRDRISNGKGDVQGSFPFDFAQGQDDNFLKCDSRKEAGSLKNSDFD